MSVVRNSECYGLDGGADGRGRRNGQDSEALCGASHSGSSGARANVYYVMQIFQFWVRMFGRLAGSY
ncbi:hypothetical protein GCM10010246_10510 [Streptomyces cuspidosporus]|uniref:Uncharacterized protein n=1 Tax=Streptomyces cuspidosporus TaxID=66882 RepID=A0ABN3FGA8_9ACTN